MSRFDDDFEHDFGVIAERVTPSPDAWASIQQRIADREPTTETEIIMLTDNTFTKRRWPLVAAAAAVVALAIGAIALVNRGDRDEQPADVPTPTVAPAPPDEERSVTTLEIPPEGSAIEPSRYTTDAFGVPASFEIPDVASSPWTVGVNNQEAIVLNRDENSFVGISRIGSFYDANEAVDPSIRGLGSIPPDGIDEWIAANGLLVDESTEVMVGGRTAQFRQLRLPPGVGGELCRDGIPSPCLNMISASADQQAFDDFPTTIATELPHSFWFVDMGDFEPLGIWASTADQDHQTWLDELAPFIASIELGEPAPAIEGGTARLSTFSAEAVSAALELPPPGGVIEPGRYASDALGVPVELDLDVAETADWALINEEPGRLWMISQGSDQELLAMGRLGSWYDATEARTADITGLGSIPPDDIDGYIAQNDIIVVASDEVEVGGRPAAFRQFRLDTTPGATGDFCDGSEPCLWASTGSPDVVGGTANPLEVGFDRVQTIWLVDMGEFEPVYIFAVAHLGEDGDQQWIDDIVQPIVDSIQFGEPAPTVEGGTARVPERVALTAEMTITQTGTPDAAAPWPVERTGSLSGDVVGTYQATGVSSPNGAEVTLDWTMDVTIDGFGSGTLTLRSEWFWSGDGAATAVDHVIAGTGDLAGVTGFGTTTQTSDFGAGVEYTADIELMLAPPTG